ncbi:MAG: radical SAM protein [Armatimonadetes bacterium]|nr:radical SAM protein [Armatimonadota bacterium]
MNQDPGKRDDEATVGPGLHHFMVLEGETPTRFHLRVDPDGGGMLLANAAEAAHLSPVGVLMVYGVLAGHPDEEILRAVKARFAGAADAQVRADFQRVRALVSDLTARRSDYPITNLVGAELGADGRKLASPYSADVTMGTLEQMQPILRSLWDAAIPQVNIVISPDTDPGALVRTVEFTEDLGMIAGVRAIASWVPSGVLREMANAGLDYLALVFASADPAEHEEMVRAEGDFLRVQAVWDHCRELELCPIAQCPITDRTLGELDEMVEFIAGRDVTDIWFFALACLDGEEEADAAGALPARALPQAATTVFEAAENFGRRIIWQPPVRFNPRIDLASHVIAGPRAGSDVAVRVEPDGSVFPARGPRTCAGNILKQTWQEIWNSPCFTRYREQVEAPSQSAACPDLPICEAWPPEDPAGWSDDSPEADTE